LRFVRHGFGAAIFGMVALSGVIVAACSSSVDPATVQGGIVIAPVDPAAALPQVVAPSERVIVFPGQSARGIDVSHYQGRIDWSRVAASGTRFVFAKATEGRNYLDPTYLENKAGAEAHGIAFGAYHFATPNRGRVDAIREANHFLDEARLRPGNLLPVLDLETTGGLNHVQLTRWILTWLRQVRDRLGVEPIVYTSPLGWEIRVGDTEAVARAGFEHLWVAHWGVDEPEVPASRWDGHGWTFWQRSACGEIPGIDGCVDVDVAGRSLDVTTIPTGLDTTIPRAGVTAAAAVDAPVVVTFDEPVVGVSDATVRLRGDDDGRVKVRLVCPSEYGVPISCASTGVQTVELEPGAPFVAGERYRVVLHDGITDLSGNALERTVGDVDAPSVLEQGSAAIAYAWADVYRDNAAGGSSLVEDRPGATASFSFWGSSVTWVTAKGPEMGRAALSVDGAAVRDVDLRSEASAFGVEVPVDGLGPGEHTLSIEVLGRGDKHPEDAPIAIDAFRTEHGLDASPTVATTWSVRADGPARLAAASMSGASAQVSFRGTGIVWHTAVGPAHGRAEISVDGVYERTVDTNASTPHPRNVRITGLDDGVHTVRIVVVPSGDDAAVAGAVAVDGFTVLS
jgi:GH25 family lysozyme M1 (1,4-beta-N-acetylmuramidase)